MPSIRQTVAVAALALSLASRSGFAGVITAYSTGFEPPTFSAGALAGQDGWLSSGTAIVENAIVEAGAQSMAIVGDAAGPRAIHASPVDSAIYPLVLLQADFAYSDSNSQWGFSGIGAGFNTLGGVVINPDGSLTFESAGNPTTAPLLAALQWYTISELFDFTTGMFYVYVNGVQEGGAAFLDPSSTQFLTGEYSAGAANGGALFSDNYSVVGIQTAIPEPSSLSCMFVGLLLCGLSARRLRRSSQTR